MNKQESLMNARLVVSFFCFILIAPGIDAAGDAKPPMVEVAQPIARAISDHETVSGRVEAAERVDLRARVTGYLMKINFKPGADVIKGDILFEIDDRPYRAALEVAEARLAVAEAQVKLAVAESDRAERLLAAKAISREDYDRMKASLTDAKSKLIVAFADRDQARLNFEYTKVTAPLAGKIGEPQVTVGNLVKADDTLLARVASVSPVYVYFNLDEHTALRVFQLMRERKDKDAPIPVLMGRGGDTGFPHSGKVDFLDNRVDAMTGAIRCRAVFKNADGTLLPGMFARVRLATSAPYEALLIDTRTVARYKAPGGQVFVVNEKNTVETREVELEWQGQLMRVKSGLKAEDWVVVKGGQALKAGMQVLAKRVVMPSSTAAQPPKKAPPESTQPSAKIKELLKERHAVLTKAAAQIADLYKAGKIAPNEWIKAQRAVIDAGLDLCESQAERIALLRQDVKQAEEMHRITQKQAETGQALPMEALQARVAVLDAQIRLLREEERAKSDKQE
jgi:multidrug efflux system membrane fusion protein